MAELANGSRRATTRIIAVLNQKGGVAKSTSAVNLGAAMAEAGRRVCLVDLDPQSHLTLHLGIDSASIDRSVYDLMLDDDCTAESCIINARPGLDLLPAEVDLAAAESELATIPDRHLILRNKLRPTLRANYDAVFIDCPPSLGLLTLNALALAREVYVPMQAHFLALQGVSKLLETVGLVCASVNQNVRVTGVLLCMHEANTTLAREVVADLDAFFEEARSLDLPWSDCRVMRPPIRRNIKLAEAPSFGKTIFDYAPWCAGANDYRILAERIMAEWDAAEPDAYEHEADDDDDVIAEISIPTNTRAPTTTANTDFATPSSASISAPSPSRQADAPEPEPEPARAKKADVDAEPRVTIPAIPSIPTIPVTPVVENPLEQWRRMIIDEQQQEPGQTRPSVRSVDLNDLPGAQSRSESSTSAPSPQIVTIHAGEEDDDRQPAGSSVIDDDDERDEADVISVERRDA